MLSFHSGSSYLDTVFEPICDRLEDVDHEDVFSEDFASEDDFEETQFCTLQDIGYTFNHAGGLQLFKKERVEAVFKKSALPRGATAIKLEDDECNICYTPTEPHELVVTACNHRYCRECLSYYLELESGDVKNLEHTRAHLETTEDGKHHLRVNRLFGIACPYPDCEHVINGGEFFLLADKRSRERYESLSLNLVLKKLYENKEITKCARGCGSWLQSCECTNKRCAEAKRRQLLREEAAAWGRAVRDLGLRACPKCNIPIEKNGGCDHMYCTQCRTRYNWSASLTAINIKRN